MHVHIGEETYSHRDLDESDFPTHSQNQTLLDARERRWLRERSIPIDPLIFVVKNENRRLEVSQFQCLSQCEIVLIPRSNGKFL